MRDFKKHLVAMMAFASMAELGQEEYQYPENVKKGKKKATLTPSQAKQKAKNRKKRKNKKR